MAETIEWIDDVIRNGRSVQHGCVDAGKLALMATDPMLFEAVTQSEIINGEGQLIVWLTQLQRNPLPERVVGVELFENLIGLAHTRGYRIYFFGARPEIVQRMVEIVSDTYSPDVVAGYRHGYFLRGEEEGIAREIAATGANMLFVGITSPIKEMFLYEHRDILAAVNFRMGVGGSFDVLAGQIPRAPKWVQNLCLEWLYRFVQEPRAKWKVEVVDSFHFVYLYLKHEIRRRAIR